MSRVAPLSLMLVCFALAGFTAAQYMLPNCFPTYNQCEGQATSHWAAACAAPMCSNGKKQSPINLQVYGQPAVPQRAPLNIQYGETAAVQSNRGVFYQWDIAVNTNADAAQVSGGPATSTNVFKLRLAATHTPSEHRINGIMYPAELQFYHASTHGRFIALAFLIEQGPRSAFLDEVIANLWLTPGRGNESDVVFNPAGAIGELGMDQSYYAYNGSFTVPPCTESVTWIVYAKPLTAAADQIDRLFVSRSRRDIQPTNDRPIIYYTNTFYPPPPNSTEGLIPPAIVAFGVPEHSVATNGVITLVIVNVVMMGLFVTALLYGYSVFDPVPVSSH